MGEYDIGNCGVMQTVAIIRYDTIYLMLFAKAEQPFVFVFYLTEHLRNLLQYFPKETLWVLAIHYIVPVDVLVVKRFAKIILKQFEAAARCSHSYSTTLRQ